MTTVKHSKEKNKSTSGIAENIHKKQIINRIEYRAVN